ncbi:EipB family protein [Aureimonas pseudogalii]|uniref:DUF1849 family protein n=1 Tax=Aureimonas pseudogalii TaxID=1744844 RepID=A0A7W6H529_9HYPH|nr:DUF1849 family protein [Aureimonas pseudogalii]MBB3998701.1 hypothetical protein [Aureimonas pseudogalii]
MQASLAVPASLLLLLAAGGKASAVDLVPHEAVYELSLAEPSDDIESVDARIALQLKRDTCAAMALDYRFVARFHQNDEITVTDQQTISRETLDGSRFDFETKTLVDGSEQETVRGQASSNAGGTSVAFTEPVTREATIALSRFPLQHTADLIQKAIAGERVVEAKIFDGDNEPDKNLVTTSLIAPAKVDAPSNPVIAEKVAGLRSWRVTESYFNEDSDRDGLPIFETRYRLFENGVTDDLFMNFGAYALSGKIGRLQYLGEATCTP